MDHISIGAGYGCGCGSGYSNGYGDGCGCGNGYSDGYDTGDGNGGGNGYSNGYGYSDGYDTGDGNGDGNGDDKGYSGYSCDSLLKLRGVILAYHVMPHRPKPHGGAHYKAEVGLVLSQDLPLAMCSSGLHASLTPEDALNYSPHGTLCRVECSGHIVFSTDKLVCETRRIVEIIGEV